MSRDTPGTEALEHARLQLDLNPRVAVLSHRACGHVAAVSIDRAHVEARHQALQAAGHHAWRVRMTIVTADLLTAITACGTCRGPADSGLLPSTSDLLATDPTVRAIAEMTAGPDETDPGVLTVDVRDRAAERPWGNGPTNPVVRTVTISALCPCCNGPRGEPRWTHQHDDGVDYWVDIWTNPCGHLDPYAAVVTEAARRETAPAEVRALHAAGELGYLPASDEWVGVDCEPLPVELQDAAHALVAAGELPEFEFTEVSRG